MESVTESSITQAIQLIAALNDPTCSQHSMAMTALNTQASSPDFVYNIFHIFSRGSDIMMNIRQLSGFIIKNYILVNLKTMPPQLQSFVLSETVRALCDNEATIRKTAANYVGKISRTESMELTFELILKILNILHECIHTSDHNTQTGHVVLCALDGSLSAIKIICEDAAQRVYDSNGNNCSVNLIEKMVPLLLRCFQHPDSDIRLHSIDALNILFAHVNSSPSNGAASNTSSIFQFVEPYLQGLGALGADPLPKIRYSVCHGIVIITITDIVLFGAMLPNIMEFMMVATQDSDEDVAMEACEFWLCLLDHQSQDEDDDLTPSQMGRQNANGISVLYHYLQRLIPLLISRMKLDDERVKQDRENEAAEAAGEKDIDMKPMHYRQKGNQDDDEEEEEEDTSKYTIRKRTAAVLDRISECYDSKFILPVALPIIQELLSSTTSCWDRESGLMALGAIASGCMEAIRGSIDSVFPYLLANVTTNTDPSTINETPPEIRSISCWVLGRYCQLLFASSEIYDNEDLTEQQKEEAVQLSKLAHDKYYRVLLEGLLRMMGDSVPSVQSAACSALFGVLQAAGDTSEEDINPYLMTILVSIERASHVYGVKNNLLLCDFIGAIADIVGPTLAETQYCNIVIPVLMKKFDSFDDNNMYLFPVMECMVSVIPAVGLAGFSDHIMNTFLRCVRIIESTLLINRYVDHIESNPVKGSTFAIPLKTCNYMLDMSSMDQRIRDIENIPVKDFAICALDILSSIVSLLKGDFVMLLQSSNQYVAQFVSNVTITAGTVPTGEALFTNALLLAVQDSLGEVKQSAMSLVGDISGTCPQILFNSDSVGVCLSSALECLGVANPRNISLEVMLRDEPMVCNNAIWMLGESFLQIKQFVSVNETHPYASYICLETIRDTVLPCLVQVLHYCVRNSSQNYVPVCVKQNIAVLIGRLAIVNTAAVASCIESLFIPWCQ